MSISLKKRVDMTQGKPLIQLLLFSYPLVLGDFLQQLYNLADTWILGNYAENLAFEAVGSVSIIIKLVTKIVIGFTGGAGIVIGRYMGTHDMEKVSKSSSTILMSFAIGGIGLTGFLLVSLPLFMKMAAIPQQLYEYAKEYVQIQFVFTIFLVLYNTCAALLRGIGDTRSPFIYLSIATVIKIILDFVLILVFHLGIAGVAYSTVIAQIISSLLCIIKLFKKGGYIEIKLSKEGFDRELLKESLAIGWPTAIQYGITQFSNLFVSSYINRLSVPFIGGYTIYYKLQQVLMLVIDSLNLAVGTAVSQNYGAKQLDRSKKFISVGLKTALLLTSFLAAVFAVFARPIATFFNKDAAVIAAAIMCLRLVNPFCVFQCFSHIYMSAMRSFGDAKTPLYLISISHIIARQLYLFIVSRLFPGNELLIMSAYSITWILGSILVSFAYKKMEEKIFVQ